VEQVIGDARRQHIILSRGLVEEALATEATCIAIVSLIEDVFRYRLESSGFVLPYVECWEPVILVCVARHVGMGGAFPGSGRVLEDTVIRGNEKRMTCIESGYISSGSRYIVWDPGKMGAAAEFSKQSWIQAERVSLDFAGALDWIALQVPGSNLFRRAPIPDLRAGCHPSPIQYAKNSRPQKKREKKKTPMGGHPPDQKTSNMTETQRDADDHPPAKRRKLTDVDPRANPYLAHHFAQESDENGYGNGHELGNRQQKTNSSPAAFGPLSKFRRHRTTADMAKTAEDGGINPFTGEPLSEQYLAILRTRRELPVHAQRDEFLKMYQKTQILIFVGETGSGMASPGSLPKSF
jgi:hypothetical protein